MPYWDSFEGMSLPCGEFKRLHTHKASVGFVVKKRLRILESQVGMETV